MKAELAMPRKGTSFSCHAVSEEFVGVAAIVEGTTRKKALHAHIPDPEDQFVPVS